MGRKRIDIYARNDGVVLEYYGLRPEGQVLCFAAAQLSGKKTSGCKNTLS
jgi:hypothetical protein